MQMNAYQIQQLLVGLDYVSIPWIQTTFSLLYSQAKEVLARLQRRGWVGKTVQGNRYLVRKENLKLRYIRRDEVNSLIEDINSDITAALQCMQENDGADYDELENAVNGKEDTDKAIKIMKDHGLAYEVDGLYFSCVSKKTVQTLAAVASTKRHSGLRFRRGENQDIQQEMKDLFDELFDDD